MKKRAHLAGVAPASPSLPRAWLATAPRGARGATHGRLQPALWQSRRHRHSSPALDVLAPRRMLSFAPKGDLGLRAHDVACRRRTRRLRRRGCRRQRRVDVGRSRRAGRRSGVVQLRARCAAFGEQPDRDPGPEPDRLVDVARSGAHPERRRAARSLWLAGRHFAQHRRAAGQDRRRGRLSGRSAIRRQRRPHLVFADRLSAAAPQLGAELQRRADGREPTLLPCRRRQAHGEGRRRRCARRATHRRLLRCRGLQRCAGGLRCQRLHQHAAHHRRARQRLLRLPGHGR